ncbi:capsular polysaccharide export protein, LipB/KpsS family [Nitratifractor sp.]
MKALERGHSFYRENLKAIVTDRRFRGWGRKRSGRFAQLCGRLFGGEVILLEDGFVRSLGLGVDGSPAFSWVEDDLGIYYDATRPSRLERILEAGEFVHDAALMERAREGMEMIRKYRISKYNHAPFADGDFLQKYGLTEAEEGNAERRKRILVIAQTAGDASLRYGMADTYRTDEIIDAALDENPGAAVYLKIHPDVLSGKKRSDIDLEHARKRCRIITEDVHPVSLLERFDRVYTKTSGMGFEALICGCECVCFGMPFYAGWGVTEDRVTCSRRRARRTVEEIFAAAYLLYARYRDPYTGRASDLFETIETIDRLRREAPGKNGDLS